MAFEYASMLMRPEYRTQLQEAYKRKIEAIVRKPGDKTDLDEPETASPYDPNAHVPEVRPFQQPWSAISPFRPAPPIPPAPPVLRWDSPPHPSVHPIRVPTPPTPDPNSKLAPATTSDRARVPHHEEQYTLLHRDWAPHRYG